MSKKMNKLILSIAIVAGMLALPVSGAATNTDVVWSGGGAMSINFQSGDDMQAQFMTGGSAINGEFHGVDNDDNPYGYNVDTSTAYVGADISGAGSFMTLQVDRQDGAGMYGGTGQQTWTNVMLNSGTAEMSFGTSTNYAGMTNAQYGWMYSGSAPYSPTTNGVTFEAAGEYIVLHQTTDADGDGANVAATGNGSTEIKMMGETSQGSGFNMGRLPVAGDGTAWLGNYATFTGTGDGQLQLNAWADNGLTIWSDTNAGQFTVPGDGTNDSASFNMTVNYAGTWSWGDFGMSGN